MRSGCRGFESRSGHLIFSSICSVYIDRHIRVDLSDDEQYVRNMPCYIKGNKFQMFLEQQRRNSTYRTVRFRLNEGTCTNFGDSKKKTRLKTRRPKSKSHVT